MLIDANLLLYSVDADSPFNERALAWLTEHLNGERRIGLPWPSLIAFLRISTHPRATRTPLSTRDAWAHVQSWLDAPVAWIPTPTSRHASVLGRLLDTHEPTANLLPDAHLAALAIEHGLAVCSADTDFARFTEARWVNPLAT
jgi:toxin-antitoxin system PIN domain toxin